MIDADSMAAPPPAEPIAVFRGEPVLEIPQDLYIPPDALEVFLETFEGPLDLLLYLIRKHNLDVLDVPMAKLTAQYLEYVELMRRKSLELAAEYLVMAAVLIEIKSRMLLPRPVHSAEGETDPRAELMRRLLAYEQMKLAAQRLDALPQVGRDFALVQAWIERSTEALFPDVEPEDLRQAWLWLLQREPSRSAGSGQPCRFMHVVSCAAWPTEPLNSPNSSWATFVLSWPRRAESHAPGAVPRWRRFRWPCSRLRSSPW